MNVFQELSKALVGRIQIHFQLPAELCELAPQLLREGYRHGDDLWFAFEEFDSQPVYLVGNINQLTSAEKLLLQMAVNARVLKESEDDDWQRRIKDAMHEPLEPYGSAVKIEDDVENISVPWNWPVILVALRPYDQPSSEAITEFARKFESLADGTELVVHLVVGPAMIVVIFSTQRGAEIQALASAEIAQALVDGVITGSFLKTKSVYSELIRSFPELLRVVKRMHFIFQAAERFVIEKAVYSVRGIGFYELLFSIKSQLRQSYSDHVLPSATLNALGSELEQTVMTFVQNNLNMSETARQLYLHRNSLIYRIERIKELTGFDIRFFQDAVTIWTALLLKRM